MNSSAHYSDLVVEARIFVVVCDFMHGLSGLTCEVIEYITCLSRGFPHSGVEVFPPYVNKHLNRAFIYVCAPLSLQSTQGIWYILSARRVLSCSRPHLYTISACLSGSPAKSLEPSKNDDGVLVRCARFDPNTSKAALTPNDCMFLCRTAKALTLQEQIVILRGERDEARAELKEMSALAERYETAMEEGRQLELMRTEKITKETTGARRLPTLHVRSLYRTLPKG